METSRITNQAEKEMPGADPTMTATMEETDRKCPRCGGALEYDPATGGLKCPYCDYTEAIQAEKDAEHADGSFRPDGRFVATEHRFTGREDMASTDWGTATKTIICKSCGAETIYDANAIANTCPYCGSVQVMPAGNDQQKIMAPGGVVTFDVDDQKASALFKKWIGHKFFCPRLAKEGAAPEKFHGVYVPYWTFDAEGSGYYTGQYGRHRQVRTSDGKTTTKTDWYSCSGWVQQSFNDVLVTGSERYDRKTLQKLEPFRTDLVKPYKPQYLAGFMAERYTVKLTDAWPKAQGIMDATMDAEARSDIQMRHHPDEIGMVHVQSNYSHVTYKYLLLPVWISSFRYRERVYRFMVNGQTGKVAGQTPISWLRVAALLVGIGVGIVLLYYILGVL